jgi:hypothetical protein
LPAPLSARRGIVQVLASPDGRRRTNGNDRLLMPRRRIGPDFVQRAIAADDDGSRSSIRETSPEPAGLRAWVGTTVDRLRQGFSPTLEKD